MTTVIAFLNRLIAQSAQIDSVIEARLAGLHGGAHQPALRLPSPFRFALGRPRRSLMGAF